MNNTDIRKLVLSLPDDSPYLEELHRRFFPRHKRLSYADRLVFALKDAAFCMHFVSPYARAGKLLPDEVWCSFLWRAWSHLRYPDYAKDPLGCEARALAHPANRATQGLLKGLLCSELSYSEVAKWLGLLPEVVETYSRWCFDFPQRRNDRAFVMSVLNPKAELSLVRGDRSTDPVFLLMRLGYQQGPEAVVRTVLLADERNRAGDNETSALKSVILRDATIKAKMALLHADDPGFTAFKSLAVATAKHQPEIDDEDMRMGAGRISTDQACQLVIKRMTEKSVMETLQYAQELDAREVAAIEAKRKAAETAAGDGNKPA